MAKAKVSQKLKKLNFINKDRRIEPMTIKIRMTMIYVQQMPM